ncbi:hypothetical protein [Candidatus Avelusimicrobium fimicolum]|uniref:hypothetical protein n=1 Tax=Candidatus Avelusimicrobium fimicolum TaxID=3416216 RepID=UPI003D0CD85D
MQSFFCRVLAVVFALNCILPTPSAWAQARRPSGQKNTTGTTARPNVGAAVSQAANKQLPTQINQTRKRFEDRSRTYYQRFQDLDKLHQLKKKEADNQAAEEKRAQEQAFAAYQRDVRSGAVMERDATYVAPAVPVLPLQRPTNDVLDLLSKDELTLQNMGDFIDPMGNTNDSFLMNTVYAAEALGNTVDYMLQAVKSGNADKAALEKFNNDLESVYLRMAYREGMLSSLPHESMIRTMAVGSLRIAMLKTHNYLVAVKKQDPLLTQQQLPGPGKKTTVITYDMVMVRKPGTDGQVSFQTKRVPKKVSQYVKQSGSVLPADHFQSVQNKYFSEMAAAAQKGLNSNDEHFQDVIALADYATKYTLLNDPASVGILVKKFDSGVKNTDFKADNAPVVNQIIAGIVDEVRQEARGSQKWNNAMQFFKNFSDPKVYSLSTRVIALEAASVLMGNQAGKETSKDEFAFRKTFALRVADLYEPLQGSYYKDYGLDSKQMQALSDKLADIYNQFATEPLILMKITNKGGGDIDGRCKSLAAVNTFIVDGAKVNRDGKCFLVFRDKDGIIDGVNGPIYPGEEGIVILNSPETSIPAIAPSNQGNMLQNPDGSIRMIYGYIYTSKGRWVEIAQHNGLNKAKVDKENAAAFFWFVGEATLWVYGGTLIEAASQAFRFARGAMLALPKAVNAAAKSNKGRALLTFRVELTKAGRLASYTSKAVNNNVTMAVRYIETGKAPATTLPSKVGEGLAPVVKTKIIAQPGKSSMRFLQNEYSRWNPRRWVGMTPNRQIVGVDFYQILPGGAQNVGSVNFAGRLATLQNGVKDYDMLRLMNHGVQGMQKTEGMMYPWLKLSVPELRAAQAYSRMQGISFDAAKSGGFDGWVNIRMPVYGSDKMPVLASQPGATGVAMESSWWNITKLGKPGNDLFSTDVVVAPAMSRTAARTAFDPLSIPGAVKFPAQMLANGQWAEQVGQQYFRIANYNNKFLDSFMPRLVPTKAFTKEFLTNPRFAWSMGKAWLKTSYFTQSLTGNLVFFGGLAGADYAVYPFVMGHITNEGQKEVQAEMASPKYGGAYDPDKLKQDEKNQEAALAQLKVDGQDYNPKQMDAYETVSGAEKESSEGMFMGSPIIFGREALGKLGVMDNMYVTMPLVKRLQYQAASVNFNRAFGEGNKIKNQKALDNIIKAQTEAIAVQKRVTLDSYKPYVSAEELKQMGAWYDEYLASVVAALRSNESSDNKQKQQEKATKLLNSRLLNKKEKVERRLELLGQEAANQEKALSEMALANVKSYWIMAFEQYGLEGKSAEVTAFFDSFTPRFLNAYDIKDATARNATLAKLASELTNKEEVWKESVEAKIFKHNEKVSTEEANPFAEDDDQLQNFQIEEPEPVQ